MEISCSIVLYHNKPEEIQHLCSKILSCNKRVMIYLMDNSADDSLRFHFTGPEYVYIYCARNLGYGGGHNLAIQRVAGRSKYHIIANPDIDFNPSVLDELFAIGEENEDIGLLMPKVLYKNGDLQYLCKQLPSPADLILRRFIPFPFKLLFKKAMMSYELRNRDYNKSMEVPNLSGCFMFIRTSVFEKVGAFDNRYFMYLEDTDLSRRINQYYKTVYYPAISIVHGYTRSSYKNFKLMVHHVKSSIKYFNKWGWFNDHNRASVNNSIKDIMLLKPASKISEFTLQ
jgi:GT2 family glycosyltransferase